MTTPTPSAAVLLELAAKRAERRVKSWAAEADKPNPLCGRDLALRFAEQNEADAKALRAIAATLTNKETDRG